MSATSVEDIDRQIAELQREREALAPPWEQIQFAEDEPGVYRVTVTPQRALVSLQALSRIPSTSVEILIVLHTRAGDVRYRLVKELPGGDFEAERI